MKKEQFLDMMNGIDDDLVILTAKTKKTRPWAFIGSLAACLLLSAAIAIPMLSGNSLLDPSIVSQYSHGELSDSLIATPKAGEVVFFREVEEARKKYLEKERQFLLAFDIFDAEFNEITDPEVLKTEYERLLDLGYELYFIEDHWTYYGNLQKKYVPIVVGLFTEAELSHFHADDRYGYAFHFETNGDGSPIVVHKSNMVTDLNSICY